MMTKKQVADIKDALRRCGSDRPGCDGCPYRGNCAGMSADALALIAERTEEVTRLRERYKQITGTLKRARWIELNKDVDMCTSCGVYDSPRDITIKGFNYCPRCGARMTAFEGIEEASAMSKAPSVQRPGEFLKKMQRAPSRYAGHLDQLYHAKTYNDLIAALFAGVNDRLLTTRERSDLLYFADVLQKLKLKQS